MAIIIEQERKKINWFSLITIAAIVGILGATFYYLFFINPSSISIVIPHKLKTLEEANRAKLNPVEILENPALKNLSSEPIAPLIIPEPAFNSNPFK